MEQIQKKKYKKRSGVVLLEICGEHLLVATKEARDRCPYVTQINQSAAFYWEKFDDAYSVNEVAEHAAQSMGKETREVLLPILLFINKMEKSGYLVEVEEG